MKLSALGGRKRRKDLVIGPPGQLGPLNENVPACLRQPDQVRAPVARVTAAGHQASIFQVVEQENNRISVHAKPLADFDLSQRLFLAQNGQDTEVPSPNAERSRQRVKMVAALLPSTA